MFARRSAVIQPDAPERPQEFPRQMSHCVIEEWRGDEAQTLEGLPPDMRVS